MSDVRGAVFSCPACQGPLASVRVADSDVEVCNGCLGVWFDWFDGEVASLSQYFATGQGQATTTAPRVCPRDGSELVAQPYLGSGPRLERCPTCLGLFVTRAQMAALQAFARQLPEAPHDEKIHRHFLSRVWHAFAG